MQHCFSHRLKGEILWANPHQLLLLAALYAKHWGVLMAATPGEQINNKDQINWIHWLGYTWLAEWELDTHANQLT